MPAHVIQIGKAAHEAEKQGLRFLQQNLPDVFTIFTNCWIPQRDGRVFEVDAVVASEDGITCVELKAYRGRITGNDNDWYVPAPIRSPLKVNRQTAQVLSSEMKRRSHDAGRAWIDHLVFLSHTNDVALTGTVSKTQVHTRKTIIDALTGRSPTARPSWSPKVDKHTAQVLHEVLTGVDRKSPPKRKIRQFDLEGVIGRQQAFTEYRASDRLMKRQVGLRVYPLDPLASAEERERILERRRWEAEVLHRVASHPHVLTAEPFILDDEELQLAIPFELFHGITLPTWVEQYRKKHAGKDGLQALLKLWEGMADALAFAHRQGVVHRLLRPEVVLLENKQDDPGVRVTGFDLAKQVASNRTIHVSSLGDDRTVFAAPEVLRNLSDATHASDQFGLGVLLAYLITGSPPFESTREYLRTGVCPRLRDRNPSISQTLDDAVQRMVELQPAKRFPSLRDAIDAVLAPVRRTVATAAHVDPEKLEVGTRLGTDYEIRGRLGEGGLGVVYLARHLVSGTDRALKVARQNDEAEDALQAEYRALRHIHGKGEGPAIVRPIDLTRAVHGHLTMVLERVQGLPLSEWLAENPDPPADVLRRFAQDLFAALIHLEQLPPLDEVDVLHRDLKPANLLVGEGGLRVIDFSLATTEDLFAGTALYKDPNQRHWSRASDRFAAALCLHELYTGRHPFNGEAPPPSQPPELYADDFDHEGLAAFFQKALDPSPVARYPSAFAMRAAFLDALGVSSPAPESDGAPTTPASDSASQPLTSTPLHRSAVAILRRAGIHTQGELVALTEEQLRGISGLGKKKARQALELRQALLDAGVKPPVSQTPRQVLYEPLVGDETPLRAAAFPAKLADPLTAAGFATVGQVADTTREDLLRIEGIGAGRVAQIFDLLTSHAERGAAGSGDGPRTPADLWARAAAPLSEAGREVLHALYGFDGAPHSVIGLAKATDRDQGAVSRLHTDALEQLDGRALDEVLQGLEARLDAYGGILSLAEATAGVFEVASRSAVYTASLDDLDPEARRTAEGLVRVVVRRNEGRLRLKAGFDGETLEVIHRATIAPEVIRDFVAAARREATWPPKDPDSSRRALARVLPGFDAHRHSPLALAERLLPDVRMTDAGELFETPVMGPDAIRYVLEKRRLPVACDALERGVQQAFGDGAIFPEPAHLPQVIADLGLGLTVRDNEVVAAAAPGGVPTRSGAEGKPADPKPDYLRVSDRSEAQVVKDMLSVALDRRGYRLLVTPPERHAEIGRSVARVLGLDYVSLEALVFEQMGERFAAFEEASRFAGQRGMVTKRVEKIVDHLLKERGGPDAKVVVGDTAILGTTDATHLVRRFYDRTAGGSLGFWALAIPGVLHQRQPWFNETEPVLGLKGQVLPVDRVLDDEGARAA